MVVNLSTGSVGSPQREERPTKIVALSWESHCFPLQYSQRMHLSFRHYQNQNVLDHAVSNSQLFTVSICRTSMKPPIEKLKTDGQREPQFW